jgi:hypothetical protein
MVGTPSDQDGDEGHEPENVTKIVIGTFHAAILILDLAQGLIGSVMLAP